MSRTYQTTGIILKGIPFQESDRLVTLLSPEYGLIRAIVPGARKPKSSLRGRCELFVINELLIAKGRSLDKITQAETLESYPGLSKDLGKLAAAQYLAELVLNFALDDLPQEEVYELLNEHLRRLERMSMAESLYSYLAQAVFHLLAIAGIGPQVHHCCVTQEDLIPNFSDPNWCVGFSFDTGGLINLERKQQETKDPNSLVLPIINHKLKAPALALLQHLSQSSLPHPGKIFPTSILDSSFTVPWSELEYVLRNYAQYHLGCSFRSVTLIDSLAEAEF